MPRVTPIPQARRRAPLVVWGSVVAPLPAEPGRARRDDTSALDAQLGLAVVAIVIYHVYQFCNIDHYLYAGTVAYTVLNSLDAAVPWLFVIVGFTAFRPLVCGVLDDRRSFSPRHLLADRAARILPVYYVAVLVVWLLRQPSLPGDWRDLIEHLTFTQVFDDKRIFYTIGPAWALSVTVWFYLIAIVLGAVMTRLAARRPSRRQRTAALVTAIIAVAAVSIAWKVWAFAAGYRPTGGSFSLWFGPIANLDNFAVGMAVAVVAGRRTAPLPTLERTALRVLGTVIIVTAFATRQSDPWSAVYFSTACSVGFGCLVAATVLGHPPEGRRPASPSGRGVVRWIGVMSFSIYIWHEPVMLALRPTGIVVQAPGAFARDTLAVLAASILAGWFSYTTIERPIRNITRELLPVD